MSERWPESVVIEADDLEYDAAATEVERAYDKAEAVDDVRRLVEDARIITTRPVPVADPAAAITSALLSVWLDGRDIGEVLVEGWRRRSGRCSARPTTSSRAIGRGRGRRRWSTASSTPRGGTGEDASGRHPVGR